MFSESYAKWVNLVTDLLKWVNLATDLLNG